MKFAILDYLAGFDGIPHVRLSGPKPTARTSKTERIKLAAEIPVEFIQRIYAHTQAEYRIMIYSDGR
jgi:hypothetical protein